LVSYNQLAGSFHAQAHLIGSHTIEEGITRYGNPSEETEADCMKPTRDESLPYWMIIDSTGRLEGLLHEVRKFELNRDVIVFVSKNTPLSYIEYLKDRAYPYHVFGDEKVDLNQMMDCISKDYEIDTILVDSGRILGNLLLRKKLVSHVSMLVHPVIVGEKGYYLFSSITDTISLKLEQSEVFDDEYVWLCYEVQN
jgi:2,5-diamino-6-(ribosylamino)-4(3H)-pyrimidinone 5'-phosphate reductase